MHRTILKVKQIKYVSALRTGGGKNIVGAKYTTADDDAAALHMMKKICENELLRIACSIC